MYAIKKVLSRKTRDQIYAWGGNLQGTTASVEEDGYLAKLSFELKAASSNPRTYKFSSMFL